MSTAFSSSCPKTGASARNCWCRPATASAPKPGQVVVAEIIAQPARHAQPVARIVEVLGNYADPGMEIEIALRKHDLPYEFPPAVEKASARFDGKVTAQDIAGREDVRELPLVTIDGETAKDFDDAVYCEPRAGKGFRLLVAIADVSHYVEHARCARPRGARLAATRCISRGASFRCCRKCCRTGCARSIRTSTVCAWSAT